MTIIYILVTQLEKMKSSFSKWPNFSKEEGNLAKKILISNNVNYWTGNECREFEKDFSNYVGSKYAIAVSNGTVAIELALRAIEIKKGDEVIVTSRSFIASVSPVALLGAKPIFTDVCRNSQNIDPKKIEENITKKTKAIICVHLAGWPCKMNEILQISKKHKIHVIEDCAQAHGAQFRGKSVGSFGDVGCWSFCQDKIITTAGEGGMITTSNKKLWKKMWEYKDHGKSYDLINKKTSGSSFKWLHNSIGTNYRMTEIQAAIGKYQLKKLDSWRKKRNINQNAIWNEAQNHECFRVPNFDLNKKSKIKVSYHAAYKCYIFVNTHFLKKGWSRDRILREINSLGVPCFTGACPEIYLEKAFHNNKISNKTAKELGETSLMFMVHPNLSKNELIKTCKAINLIGKKATK